MTAPNDFDRQLAAWLGDGPAHAPEHPIDLAVAHARSHPRWRDPFGFLRSDPMPPRRVAGRFRLVWAVAAVALLVLALVGVAVVGGRPSESVVPPPSASPPTITASASPRTLAVDITDELGKTHSVAITDRSGLLVDAASGQARAADEFGSSVALRQDGASALRLTWVTCPQDTGSALSIDATGRRFAFVRGACIGDTLGVGVVLVLTFSGPIDGARIEATTTDRPVGG